MSAKLPVSIAAAALLVCACAHTKPSEALTISWVAEAEANADRSAQLLPEDIVSLRDVSDVELSPDGKTVAYVLRVPSPLDEPGRAHSQIWLVDAAGKHAAASLHARGRQLVVAALVAKRARARVLVQAPARRPHPGLRPDRRRRRGPAAVRRARARCRRSRGRRTASQVAYTSARPTDAAERERNAGHDWVVDEDAETKARLFVVNRATGDDDRGRDRRRACDRVSLEPRRPAARPCEPATKASVDATMMYSSLYDGRADRWRRPTPAVRDRGQARRLRVVARRQQIAFLGAADLHDSTAGIVYVVPASGGEAKPLTAALEATGMWLAWNDPNAIVLLCRAGRQDHRLDGRGRRLDQAGRQTRPDLSRAEPLRPTGRWPASATRPPHPREVFTGRLGAGLTRITVSNPTLLTRKLGEQSVVTWTARTRSPSMAC